MKPLDNRNEVMDIRASDRTERNLAALRPAYFRIDERAPHDLVKFAAGFFREITFYNTQGRPDGNWSPFFEDDPVIALFLIRAFPAKELRKNYVRLFRDLTRSSDRAFRLEMLEKITLEILSALYRVETLREAVSAFDDFHQRLRYLVRIRLSKVLAQFRQVENILAAFNHAEQQRRLYDYGKDFSADWHTEETLPPLPDDHEAALRELVRNADEQAFSLFYSIDELRHEADTFLTESVKSSGRIKAHIALLLTFFDLYKLAQDKLNTFTGKHLDYYYESVLKIRRLPRTHGEAYVVLKLAEASPAQELPAETLFSAGAGKNGEELLYALKEPLIVNAAAIRSVIGVECNHAWEEKSRLPEQPFPFRSYFQAGDGYLPSFPKDVNTASHGYGFAISSPVLAQPEGDRKFSFHFTCTTDSFRDFISGCRIELEKRKADEPEYESELPEEERINRLLRNTLKISTSSPDGWHEVPGRKVDFFVSSFSDCRLQVDVLLETTDPPVSPVLDETYTASFAPQLPVIRFLLHSDTSPVYRFLRFPVIEKTEIGIEATGIRNLLLRNDYGPLPTDAPFEMFGPQPRPGAAFFLGHPVLLSPLYDLRVTLEWNGLPVVDGGFATHYRGYDYIRDNSTFKCVVMSLRHNRWIPSEYRPLVELFQDAPGGTKAVSPLTRLNNFDLHALELDRSEEPLAGPGPFPGADKAGFLRFEFCYPPNGFGHLDYPSLVNQASQEMARNKKDIVPLPNEPYTPVLKRVLLDFKMKQTIRFGESGNYFYQLYPFGKEQCTAGKRLVPFFRDGSTLFIGIAGVEDNSTLSLLTRIDDAVSAVAPGVPEVRWSMRRGGKWEPLTPAAFISDETGRLKRTGITRFIFSGSGKGDGHLFDAGLTWLKAESVNDLPFLALIAQMHTQAGVIRLESGEPNEAVLPPFTVKALHRQNAAIESVTQPYASAGDRPEETRDEWYSRISEHLRHRGRAVSNWDYERLVLQQFPDVQMVKCISHVNNANLKAAGSVLVAVLPATEHSGDLGRKGLFTLEKLQEIAAFLGLAAPAGVHVNVVNPQYEKLRVKLRVKFGEGYDEVFYTRRLNEDITGFLDPWKDGSGLQPRFGVSVSGFTILNFIENLYYVDFVTNFSVFHLVNGKVINPGGAATEIAPSSPISMLVSDQEHIVNLFDGTASDSGGINEMMIGTDFIMNADQELQSSAGVSFGKVGKDFIITGAEENTPRPAGVKLKMKINA